MSVTRPTINVASAVRRLLRKADANAAIWILNEEGAPKLCVACHFSEFGWLSLDSSTPLEQMLSLLMQSGQPMKVEPLSDDAEAIAAMHPMQARLGLLSAGG